MSSVLQEALPKLPEDFLQGAASKSQKASQIVLDALDGRMLLIFVDQLDQVFTTRRL